MKIKPIAENLLKHTPFYPVHIGNYIRDLYFWKYLKKLPVDKFIKVLDAGCGNGQYAKKMAQKFPWITVIAMDAKTQDFQGDHSANLFFREANLLKLEDNHIYDFIYCIDVLEHISNNTRVMEHFYRALKEGGYLYIHMPYAIGEIRIFPDKFFAKFNDWADKEHVGEQYTLDEIKSILQKLGFEIMGAEHTFGFLGKFAWELDRISDEKIILKIILMPLLKFLGLLSVNIPHRTGHILVMAKK